MMLAENELPLFERPAATTVIYCYMHAYDWTFIRVTLPSLVSMNLSSDDLIESVYYMFIPMHYISSFCINT